MTTEITTAETATSLAKLAPHRVNAELQWRASSLNVNVNVKYAGAAIKEIDVSGPEPGLMQLIGACEGAMTGPTNGQAERWLAELSVAAPKRQDDEFTESLRVEVYARNLLQYPADLVCEALTRKTWKFFPSLYELKEVLDDGVKFRRALIAGIRRAMQAKTEPPRVPASKEAVDKIMAEFMQGLRK